VPYFCGKFSISSSILACFAADATAEKFSSGSP
jgi:hypothetical protein